jgi:hypothetical protein
MILPSLDKALKKVDERVGRRAASDAVAGGVFGFVFDASMPDLVAKELAWASFALLKNTNACAVAFGCKQHLLLSRGFLGEGCVPAGKTGKPTFDEVADSVARDLGSDLKCLEAEKSFRSREELLASGLTSLRLIPRGVQTAFVSSFYGDRVWMLVMSDFEAGFGPKEVQWLRNVGLKVVNAHGGTLTQQLSDT